MSNKMTFSDDVSSFISQYGVNLTHADTGNTTAIIAAIPSAMDPVRLIGDEDKHATLLFFGETSTLPADAKTTLTSTLEQVSKMLSPFREGVRDVARLGSDNPPALVVMLTNRNLGRIRDIVQVNPAVKGYLSNATQYPSFTPHVTLGYPDYQGETELRDLAKGLYGIKFDKLALWWNDERIEFDLNDMLAVGESEDSMAMADDLVADFLAHHGVKGQKWGVRRDTSAGGATYVKTVGSRGAIGSASIANRPGDFAKSGLKGTALNLLGNIGSAHIAPITSRYADVAPLVRIKAKALNQKYSQPGKNLATDKKLKSAYDSEFQKMVIDTFSKTQVKGLVLPSVSAKIASKRIGDMSKLKYDFTIKGKTALLHVTRADGKTESVRVGKFKPVKIKHADAMDFSVDIPVELVRDSNGYITDFSIPDLDAIISDEKLNHSDDLVENFLAHHGIRGMKWGIRRANPSGGVDLSGVSRKDARSMKKDAAGTIRAHKTSDGKTILVQKQKDGSWKETHLSPDQQRLHEALGKPLHELSNQEVRDVVERQRLINSYNEMFAPKNNPQQGQGKSELQLKVEHLELQKRLADAQRALTPPKKDRVQSFTKKVSTGWKAFNAIDKTLNHNLSKGISRRLGLEPPLTQVQKLKAQNELLALRKKNIKDTVDIVELSKLHTNLLDAPSLAPNYSTPGKRRKHTGEPIFNLP